MSYIVLSKEDRKLLLDTRKLLEELLETLDILSNLEEIKALEQSDNYRIIYTIDDNKRRVVLHTVVHRRRAYKP